MEDGMQDRLARALENQLRHLLKVLAMMQTGAMTTRISGKDATKETIDEYRALVVELEQALHRHRLSNA